MFLEGNSNPTGGSLMMLAVTAAFVVIMYFVMIRPQKKKEKEAANMRSSLQVGDEVITIGGIVGRIVSIKDENVSIETGADRQKIKVKRWAIQGKDAEIQK